MASKSPVVSRSTSLHLLIGLTGLTLLASCREDEGPGSIVIPFEFALNRTCDELGVTRVRATLAEDIADDAPCDEGEVRLEDVPAGTYDLVLEGLDGSGVAVVDNGATQDTVEVVGDNSTTTEDAIELTATPAKLWIRWDFDYVTCDTVSFSDLMISAYDAESTQNLHDAEFACDAPPDDGMDGYHLVEDEGRDLIGDNFNYVEIQPVDDSGADVGPEIVFEFAPVGAGYPVEISLRCDEDGCDCTSKDADDQCLLD